MRIGLTGSIGTGKSTVVQIFKEEGLPCVDADALVHRLYEEDETKKILKEAFGSSILNGEGDICRKTLGNKVFRDPLLLRQLNELIHPLIWNRIQEEGNTLLKQYDMVIYDIPLLLEANMISLVDLVVLVTCKESIQLQRIMQRDSCTLQEAKRRIASQMPQEEKMKYADYKIDNSGSKSALRQQVQEVLKEIKAEGPRIRARKQSAWNNTMNS